jgi:hypothetical protein
MAVCADYHGIIAEQGMACGLKAGGKGGFAAPYGGHDRDGSVVDGDAAAMQDKFAVMGRKARNDLIMQKMGQRGICGIVCYENCADTARGTGCVEDSQFWKFDLEVVRLHGSSNCHAAARIGPHHATRKIGRAKG